MTCFGFDRALVVSVDGWVISRATGCWRACFSDLFFTTLRLNLDIQFDSIDIQFDSLIDIELELALRTALM